MSNAKPHIRIIDQEEELLEKYSWIQQVPLINIPHRELLIKCLQGRAVMIVGTLDDQDLGVAIIERTKDTLSVLAGYCVNNLKLFIKEFYSWANRLGIKRITMMSAHPPEAFARLTGANLLTAIYEKDLTKWEQE